MRERRIHQIFEASVLLKGAHALVECVGGVALAFVSTNMIVVLVNRLTQEELSEDPRDFIANHLLSWAHGLSIGTKEFYGAYLLGHGVVKLFLVAGLLRRKLWSYPVALIVLGLFIVYQLYRFSHTHGIGLLALTVFDAMVMGLIWHEYRVMRRDLPAR